MTSTDSIENDFNSLAIKEPKSLNDLIHDISNPYQKDILERLLISNEESQIYLSEFDTNTKKVTLLGTYNHKKNKREAYEVKIYDSGKCSFWCSCPYHKFKSSKENTVCKHICFLVCKIAKHYSTEFFESKIIDKDVLDTLIDKLNGNDIWKDKCVCKKLSLLKKDHFHNYSKEIEKDDMCPICYDEFNIHQLNGVISCPSCENYIHTECMNVWLERHNTCVYCRSDIWKYYKTVESGCEISIV